MRGASGRICWASGGSVAIGTVRHMLDTGTLVELDTDLFGNPHRGQTLGVITDNHA